MRFVRTETAIGTTFHAAIGASLQCAYGRPTFTSATTIDFIRDLS
jgi:hypothetical protein